MVESCRVKGVRKRERDDQNRRCLPIKISATRVGGTLAPGIRRSVGCVRSSTGTWNRNGPGGVSLALGGGGHGD